MKRKIFLTFTTILLVIVVVGCNSSKIKTKINQYKVLPNNSVETNQKEDLKQYASYPFTLTMLDVGQGLCILVRSGDDCLVYDGGGRERSSYVVSFFKRNQINKIKYMIASHYDEDHIAGLVGLLKTIPVNTVIIPDYGVNTSIYSSFKSALNKADSVVYAEAGKKYTVGDAIIEILHATGGTEEKENNRSTVIKIKYNGFSCIITGDAEREAERKLVERQPDLSCNLYVVGHHGSSSSSSFRFVYAMKPNLAFISAGKDNKYGHPTKRVLKVLDKNKVKVYRTDKQGTVTLVHDGLKYEVKTTKNESTEETSQNR